MTLTTLTTIPVPGEQPYDVIVGPGAIGRLPEVLGDRVAKVLIVHPPTLGARASALRDEL